MKHIHVITQHKLADYPPARASLTRCKVRITHINTRPAKTHHGEGAGDGGVLVGLSAEDGGGGEEAGREPGPDAEPVGEWPPAAATHKDGTHGDIGTRTDKHRYGPTQKKTPCKYKMFQRGFCVFFCGTLQHLQYDTTSCDFFR